MRSSLSLQTEVELPENTSSGGTETIEEDETEEKTTSFGQEDGNEYTSADDPHMTHNLTREEDLVNIYGDHHNSIVGGSPEDLLQPPSMEDYTENPMQSDSDWLRRERAQSQQDEIVGKSRQFAQNDNLVSAERGTVGDSMTSIHDQRKLVKKRESKAGGTDVVGTQQVKNIFEDMRKMKFFRLCYTITSWHIYWLIYTFIIIIEPFLISQNPYRYPGMWRAQQVLLLLSSILFGIQYFGSLYLVKKMLQEERSGHVTHWEMWKTSTLSPPFYLEIACFACGWVFIWQFPGIASLRCFRFLRIFWYYDLPEPILGPVKTFFAYFAGLETVELSLKVMEFASRTLESMGQEMFYLSKKTRGGFILVFIMFFSSYILGVVLFISTEYSEDYEGMADVPSEVCYSVPSCMYIMVRLTFFDGDAFNYVYTLVTDHPILFGVVCIYFFLTAIGITNGLIGVFGDIFKEASNNTFANNTEFMPILSRLTRIESVLLGVDASNVEQMGEVAELAKEEAAHNGVSMEDFNLADLGDEFDGTQLREYSPDAVSKQNKLTEVEERLDKMETMLSLILARLPDASGRIAI